MIVTVQSWGALRSCMMIIRITRNVCLKTRLLMDSSVLNTSCSNSRMMTGIGSLVTNLLGQTSYNHEVGNGG